MLGLQFQTFEHRNDGCWPRQADREIYVAVNALDLYRSVLWRARLRRWWSALTRRPHFLLRLNQVVARDNTRSNHSVEMCTVPIRQIRGSESRTEDFDADFRPLQKRTQRRWLGIAYASMAGVALPPVELIRVGKIYFVRDGHHRISVARALGQQYIEAEVSVWEVGEQPLCDRPALVHMKGLEVTGLFGGLKFHP